jgi:hypothetical protein
MGFVLIGCGLGLKISKTLCNVLGGDLTFTSEWGKGTSFKIVLPLNPRDSQSSVMTSLRESFFSNVNEVSHTNTKPSILNHSPTQFAEKGMITIPKHSNTLKLPLRTPSYPFSVNPLQIYTILEIAFSY